MMPSDWELALECVCGPNFRCVSLENSPIFSVTSNHEICKETLEKIRQDTRLLAISGVYYLSTLRVSAYVFHFYFYVVCLHVCAYAFKFKVHCGSALGPGASGLPCTPPVTVPDVIEGLAVWQHNNKKKRVLWFILV